MSTNDDNPVSPYPHALTQNPAANPLSGQDYNTQFQALVNEIMRIFLTLLPDNYVSQVNGPFYTLQFQAIAEALARIQLLAQQITLDNDFDFTRPDFLFQILGKYVFPDADEDKDLPVIPGDKSYRRFLQDMVCLLLRGSKAIPIAEGVGLTADDTAVITIVEKFLGARDPQSAWGFDEQFEFEVNVSVDGGTAFPTDPFTFQENVRLILKALRPAHTLYELRFVFNEMVIPPGLDLDNDGIPDGGTPGSGNNGGYDFGLGDTVGQIFDDTDGMSWEMDTYYYDDLRKFCYGAKEISGTGDTLSGRFQFSDPDVSFESISVGAVLQITSGTNVGLYEVTEIRHFPFGDDATARAYTTSPTGLSGTATVSGDEITDSTQDFGAAEEGEILTFTEGPNAGSYRLQDLLGPNGGPLSDEDVVGPGTEVRVSPSILVVDKRMPSVETGQSYTVTVDRLGVRSPKDKDAEDVSWQFVT